MLYAKVQLLGNNLAPNLDGVVDFYSWLNGTLLKIEVANLPKIKEPSPSIETINFFAFGIYEKGFCDNVSMLNSNKWVHSFHINLPAILSNEGYAYMVVYTNQFKPSDILGKEVAISLYKENQQCESINNIGSILAYGKIMEQI